MAIFTADVEGLEELMEQVKNLGYEGMQYIKRAADEAGNLVLQRTQSKIPVKTGEAKKSLRLKVMAVKPKKLIYYSSVTFKGTSIRTGETGQHHIIPLELGHKLVFMGKKTGERVEAKPFMRPAADESKEEVIDIITKHLNWAIEDLGGK